MSNFTPQSTSEMVFHSDVERDLLCMYFVSTLIYKKQ